MTIIINDIVRTYLGDVQMVAAIRIEDLKTALAVGLTHLTEDQVIAVKEFVRQVGGIENAERAINSLEELKKAS